MFFFFIFVENCVECKEFHVIFGARESHVRLRMVNLFYDSRLFAFQLQFAKEIMKSRCLIRWDCERFEMVVRGVSFMV
jgi:hypothetical protein